MPLGGFNGKPTQIYSLQLTHALEIVFGLKISHDELMQQLPSICKRLKVELEPLTDADTKDRSISAYCINLS